MGVDTWITRIVVILGFITTVITLYRVIRVAKKTEEVHVMVNSRYTDISKRVEQLVNVLKGHGIDIPADPNDSDVRP